MQSDSELRERVRGIVHRVLSEERSLRQTGGLADSGSIAIGADHGGFDLKEHLVQFLASKGLQVLDCGTFSPDPVDYPDVAFSVARLVSEGAARFGIVVDGAGIGSAMVANKVPGVRAAMCYDEKSARNAREHNDANVLTLGGRVIDAEQARGIVNVFLSAECTEPRHRKRVAKISEVERRFLRK